MRSKWSPLAVALVPPTNPALSSLLSNTIGRQNWLWIWQTRIQDREAQIEILVAGTRIHKYHGIIVLLDMAETWIPWCCRLHGSLELAFLKSVSNLFLDLPTAEPRIEWPALNLSEQAIKQLEHGLIVAETHAMSLRS